MGKRCEFCGDELTDGHKNMAICGWCIKEIDDSQKAVKENIYRGYFNRDRDEYKVEDEINYG